ncbi:hypothetical protein XELAEV_18009765mg [Xenopus laevis]|uniref:Uncharacterized protein n=1 Tax=Xenopus laevis TaxID=8355 RepID=A0A974DTF0_XENLA|nr:hypothetical protein XELAEV_18009765mg [Xenopus laevis]
MSSLAILAFKPFSTSRVWSNDRYCTEHCSLSIPTFTELPFGYDKCCISLNLHVSFLGTTPNGDMIKPSMGGSLKVHIILPSFTSFIIFLRYQT